MAITSFTWRNGTGSNPVPLTTTMMDNLIRYGNTAKAANDAAKAQGATKLPYTVQVSGYYTGSGGVSVVKSRVWSLKQLFPNLNYIGNQADDRFSISTVSSDMTEGGQSVRIIPTGINASYLKYQIIFDEILINEEDTSIITADAIKSRFSIGPTATEVDSVSGKIFEVSGNAAYIIVAAPEENATWSVRFRIKACPVYENMETTTNFRRTDQNADGSDRAVGVGVITCSAVKMTGVSISANAEMGTNTYNTIIKTPIPATSTKLSKVTYSFNISGIDAEYVEAYEAIHSGNTAGTINVTCWPHLFGDNLPVSNTLEISVWASRATTIRINQNISDPTAMVLNPDSSGYRNRLATDNVIAYIRQNSHCYVGKFYGEVEGMKIKQLWDSDRRYYYDASADEGRGALAPIDGTPDDDGIIADVFLRLPEFYYKTVNEVNDNDEETGIVAISFATGQLDEGYHRWDPNTLIGVYEGTIINDGTYDKLYSVSGTTPKNNYSQSAFKTAARRRNDQTAVVQSNHFSIINYQAHVVMALLYYCYWGSESINCQALIGSGTSTYPKTTGMTDSLGMTETSAVGNGNTGSINFWGLENWWGDLSEFVDDLQTANANGTVNILKYNGSVDRQVQTTPMSDGSSKCVVKFKFGANADLIYDEVQSGSQNWNLNFCDGGYVNAGSGYVASRGISAASASGGVGCLYVYYSPSYADANRGSRLLYNGAVTVVDSL